MLDTFCKRRQEEIIFVIIVYDGFLVIRYNKI